MRVEFDVPFEVGGDRYALVLEDLKVEDVRYDTAICTGTFVRVSMRVHALGARCVPSRDPLLKFVKLNLIPK